PNFATEPVVAVDEMVGHSRGALKALQIVLELWKKIVQLELVHRGRLAGVEVDDPRVLSDFDNLGKDRVRPSAADVDGHAPAAKLATQRPNVVLHSAGFAGSETAERTAVHV